jgi:hypothetical protein
MKRSVLLILLLSGLLAHCVSVPRQPEPEPPAPEVVARPAPPKERTPPPETQQEPQPVPQPVPYMHEVRWHEETLSHIALWYTGSQNNWQKISRANGGLKPGRINIGDRILIPEELLKKREPMPRQYLSSPATPKEHRKTESSQPQKDPGNEQLFEPVELLSPQEPSEKTELYGPVELIQTPEHSQPSPADR